MAGKMDVPKNSSAPEMNTTQRTGITQRWQVVGLQFLRAARRNQICRKQVRAGATGVAIRIMVKRVHHGRLLTGQAARPIERAMERVSVEGRSGFIVGLCIKSHKEQSSFVDCAQCHINNNASCV